MMFTRDHAERDPGEEKLCTIVSKPAKLLSRRAEPQPWELEFQEEADLQACQLPAKPASLPI